MAVHELRALRRSALAGAAADADRIFELAADARFVLIGEASHGTHEFYAERAAITRRLIDELGFTIVAAEADWPDAYRVNRYVRGAGTDASADEALSGFKRFPAWMWRNTVVLEFVEWLRERNASVPEDRSAGFYGLDLYSLNRSIEAVLAYLAGIDPGAARRARERYSCFDHAGQEDDGGEELAAYGAGEECEREAVEQLVELQHSADAYVRSDGLLAEDEHFYAVQNARVVVEAARYYQAMFRGRIESWNLRDRHMTETLAALVDHLGRRGPAKAVVWAHNSHLGDARATELGAAGELNVGQLVRERWGDEAVLLGMTTATGTVTAANDWGGPAERMDVREPFPGSYEELLHAPGEPSLLLDLRDEGVRGELAGPRLERAIGVIYRPRTERLSHYFHAHLPAQFDLALHLDDTSALEPLEPWAPVPEGEVPETFPHAV
jgi:erythromycin esterase-like protein